MSELLVTVRCNGCGRGLGISPSNFRAYCDQQCADELPILPNEDRDSLLSAMHASGEILGYTSLAKVFGVSRQRVEQIISARQYR